MLQPSGGNNDKMKGVMTIESSEQSTELEELGKSLDENPSVEEIRLNTERA